MSEVSEVRVNVSERESIGVNEQPVLQIRIWCVWRRHRPWRVIPGGIK